MDNTINHEQQSDKDFPILIGYLGLIPFLISSIAIWVSAYQDLAYNSLAIYGCVILTFVGAVHWGIGITQTQKKQLKTRFIFSIAPSLVSWLVLLIAHEYALLILAFSFTVSWLIERSSFAEILPKWYVKLRDRLSFFVIGFLLLGWFGAIQ